MELWAFWKKDGDGCRVWVVSVKELDLTVEDMEHTLKHTLIGQLGAFMQSFALGTSTGPLDDLEDVIAAAQQNATWLHDIRVPTTIRGCFKIGN
jgi:glutamate/tyrosine decarboxylase-like PLP-dependent enzyme